MLLIVFLLIMSVAVFVVADKAFQSHKAVRLSGKALGIVLFLCGVLMLFGVFTGKIAFPFH